MITVLEIAGLSVVDRLVGRGPEIATDIRRTGGCPGGLGHQDGDHVLSGSRQRADRIDVHLAAPADQGDQARHFAALDIAVDDVVRAAETRPGRSCTAHRLFRSSSFILFWRAPWLNLIQCVPAVV